MICMLRMLVVFFVWEVEGFCVLGLTLNVAAFSLCTRGNADPVDNFTVYLVTIKCLGIVVLSMTSPVLDQLWEAEPIHDGQSFSFHL